MTSNAPLAFAAGFYTITAPDGRAITAPASGGQPLTVETLTGAANQQWLINGSGVFIAQDKGFTVNGAAQGSTVNSNASSTTPATPFIVANIADLLATNHSVSGAVISVDNKKLCWAINGTSQVYLSTIGGAVTWTFTPV